MIQQVLENKKIGNGYYHLAFSWPGVTAKAGQFVMIRTGDGNDPLLRRPMSLARQGKDTAEVVYRVVGRGTGILSRKRKGETVDVTGPFGNGFNPPSSDCAVILLGGGVGIPPLLFYAEQNQGQRLIAIIGGRTKKDILFKEAMEKLCSMVIVTTEDGSMGMKGLVIDPLEEADAVTKCFGGILACGPPGMLKAVDGLAVRMGLYCELALEERMGCGFGVCLGCMIETNDGAKRVCVEGPVFRAGTIRWR